MTTIPILEAVGSPIASNQADLSLRSRAEHDTSSLTWRLEARQPLVLPCAYKAAKI